MKNDSRQLGGNQMVGLLGVVVSPSQPTSQIEGRGLHHHHRLIYW